MSSPCESKVLYDTVFEAELGVARSEHRWGREMEVYRCGSHYHIANKEKSLRSRYRKFSKRYCDECDVYLKQGQWRKHLKSHKQRKTPLE